MSISVTSIRLTSKDEAERLLRPYYTDSLSSLFRGRGLGASAKVWFTFQSDAQECVKLSLLFKILSKDLSHPHLEFSSGQCMCQSVFNQGWTMLISHVTEREDQKGNAGLKLDLKSVF